MTPMLKPGGKKTLLSLTTIETRASLQDSTPAQPPSLWSTNTSARIVLREHSGILKIQTCPYCLCRAKRRLAWTVLPSYHLRLRPSLPHRPNTCRTISNEPRRTGKCTTLLGGMSIPVSSEPLIEELFEVRRSRSVYYAFTILTTRQPS